MTKWDSLTRLFKTAVKEFGRIDIVLANAGVPEIEDFFADTFEANGDLQEPKYIVLDIDLKGVLASKLTDSLSLSWKLTVNFSC